MTARPDASPDANPDARPRHRLRFELIFGSILLGFGLFALPGIIYWVGTALLGPYAEGAGAGTFYGDFFGDLATGSMRAWMLALGPLALISLIRLIFLRRPTDAGATADVAAPQPRPAPQPEHRRVEPRVSLD